MKTIQIDGLTIHGVTDEQERILRGREAVVKSYCATKGWDANTLTVAQVLEIRALPEWKSPS